MLLAHPCSEPGASLGASVLRRRNGGESLAGSQRRWGSAPAAAGGVIKTLVSSSRGAALSNLPGR